MVLDRRTLFDAGHEIFHLCHKLPRESSEKMEHVPATGINEFCRCYERGDCNVYRQ